MVAYVLVLLAVLTRVLPHAGLWNFTAVGGALLYFGARRSWKEMLAPLAVLMATDYYLTTYVYHYPFQIQGYMLTWSWYVMAGDGRLVSKDLGWADCVLSGCNSI